MVTKYKIYGERGTGTNYLEDLMSANFNIIKAKQGSKHFFGFSQLINTDDTLFICIVRHPIDWLNSLYKRKHHLPPHLTTSVPKFLNSQWYSVYDSAQHLHKGEEIMQDRHIYTNNRYDNIFEMRHIKHKYLIDDLPNIVKNYMLIKYEDLLFNFDTVMQSIKDIGVPLREDITFPVNITWNCKNKKQQHKIFTPDKTTKRLILANRIYKHPNFNTFYEKQLGYVDN